MNPDETGAPREPAKKFLLVNRRAPWGTIYALEGLEVALIAAAYGQDLSLLFLDDGVYQLLSGMDSTEIEMKNFSRTYLALEGLEVNKIYVETDSLSRRGLTEDLLAIAVTSLSRDEVARLLADQDVIINF